MERTSPTRSGGTARHRSAKIEFLVFNLNERGSHGQDYSGRPRFGKADNPGARAGRVVLRKVVRRERLLALLAQFPRCVVGTEACSGAHQWARQLTQLGHDIRIMAAEFVRPFRKSVSAKNDANDAEAVCTAMVQPNMG